MGLNTGTIMDCYSKIRFRHSSHIIGGGFCGENRGKILRCFAQGSVSGKGKKAGFCARQKGSCEKSFWLYRKKPDESDWTDWTLALSADELGEDRNDQPDLPECWHMDRQNGKFQELKLYDVRPEDVQYENIVEIGTRKELVDFARQVNGGEARRNTLYRLTSDIDLGGRAWIPVGPDANTPFQGVFDGAGYRISNFVVHANKHPFAGFFGYVGRQGQIMNLNLDCQIIRGGSTAGSLCAVNEGTVINCTASSKCGFSRCTGVLAGQNSGTIVRSAALGRAGKDFPIPWWASALLLLLLCLPLPLYFAMTAQATAQEIFAPVIIDPNARPIEPEDDITPQPDEVTDTSASFIMNAEMYVSTENYAGAIGLRCPRWSTRGFVATVRLTVEDQEKIGYSGGEAVTLYQSGLIAPGYGVDVITLSPLPDGTRLPAGEYELSVLLEFYDTETNEKSAVNTVVPLEVTVG